MRRFLLMATSMAALAGAPAHGRADDAAPAAAPAPQVQAQVQDWINQTRAVREAATVYVAPDETAATHGRLPAGSDVRVIATLVDGGWLQVRLPDDSVGYVKAATVALVDPSPAATADKPDTEVRPDMPVPPGLAPPADVDGRPLVRDTATLVIDGKAILLAGVEGVGGEAAGTIQDYIATLGDTVSCAPQAEMPGYFTCRLTDQAHTDLAKLLLVNGLARIAAGAPDDYTPQQDAAVEQQKGIWALQDSCVRWAVADAVASVPFTDDADEGLYFANREPFVVVSGEPVPVVFDVTNGWGFWGADQQWNAAPDRWRRHLDNVYPHGARLRDPSMRAHDLREGPVRQVAVHELEVRQHSIEQHHTIAERLGHAPAVPEMARPHVLREHMSIGRPPPRQAEPLVERPRVPDVQRARPVEERPHAAVERQHPPEPHTPAVGERPRPVSERREVPAAPNRVAPRQSMPVVQRPGPGLAAPHPGGPAFHAMPTTHQSVAPSRPACKKGC